MRKRSCALNLGTRLLLFRKPTSSVRSPGRLLMLRSGKLRRRAAQDGAQRIISNYVRDLAVAPKFCLCCSFKVCCVSEKDRHGAAFLQQLVNMTLYPAEQKKGARPRAPTAWHVHLAVCTKREPAGSETCKIHVEHGQLLQTAGSWQLQSPSTGQDSKILPALWVFKIFIVLKYGDHGRRLFICAPGLQPWARQTYECHTTVVFHFMEVSLFHLTLNGKSLNIFTAGYENAWKLIIRILASEFNPSNFQ